MYTPQQVRYVQPGQLVSGAQVGGAQTFDISTLLASIMPLIMLVMVMQMVKPLMAGLTAKD